jgi:hypothetical protein
VLSEVKLDECGVYMVELDVVGGASMFNMVFDVVFDAEIVGKTGAENVGFDGLSINACIF